MSEQQARLASVYSGGRKITITDVSVTLFKWTGLQPTTYTSQATPTEGRDGVLGLVTISTDAGIEGHCFLGSSIRPASIDAPGLIEMLKPVLIGQNALDRDRLFRLMSLRFRAVMLRTIGALDTALWDIGAKAANMPLYQLLGAARDKVPVYASSSTLKSVQAYVDQALEVRAAGYHGYKIHPPHDHSLHAPVIQKVREAVGDSYTLMYDSAMMYRFEEALRVGRVLERNGFRWFEDPLPVDDMYNYTKLCAALDIDVMATEYSHGGFFGYAQWITAQATDSLRGDVAVKGGVTACVKGAHLAEGFGMSYELHHGGNSFNNVANLHVAAAIPNCGYLEVLLPHNAQKYGLVVDLDIDAEGYMTAPGTPGITDQIDFDLIKRNTIDIMR